jgi:hypothetical protein
MLTTDERRLVVEWMLAPIAKRTMLGAVHSEISAHDAHSHDRRCLPSEHRGDIAARLLTATASSASFVGVDGRTRSLTANERATLVSYLSSASVEDGFTTALFREIRHHDLHLWAGRRCSLDGVILSDEHILDIADHILDPLLIAMPAVLADDFWPAYQRRFDRRPWLRSERAEIMAVA